MGIPYRRCIYLTPEGPQCETWFEATTDDKLCPAHREVVSPSARDGFTQEQKVKYIDLVNEQREYCHHFKDGTAEHQDKTLIFEFKDDQDGTSFEKLDRHIAFLEKVLEDVKARYSASRAVRVEKLDKLNEDERAELRKQRLNRMANEARDPQPIDKSPRAPSIKKDPIAHLMKKNAMSASDASALLSLDPEALIAKFKAAKEKQS